MVARPALTRRALLALAGMGAVVAACGGNEGSADERRIRYGDLPDQFGRLGEPIGDPVGLAVLVHGGFWSARYGLDLMDPVAADLRKRGFATWNIEYRRVGEGGGFAATLLDVAAAFDRVRGLDVDPALPAVALGHSAGGHLAAWAASRTARTPGGAPRFVPGTTIALSGILCLAAAERDGLGGGAVTEFMNGERFTGAAGTDYDLADPVRLTPPTGRLVAVHAADDVLVPVSQSTDYVTAARAAGGDADLVDVPGDHFDLIDPSSDAWTRVVDLLPG